MRDRSFAGEQPGNPKQILAHCTCSYDDGPSDALQRVCNPNMRHCGLGRLAAAPRRGPAAQAPPAYGVGLPRRCMCAIHRPGRLREAGSCCRSPESPMYMGPHDADRSEAGAISALQALLALSAP